MIISPLKRVGSFILTTKISLHIRMLCLVSLARCSVGESQNGSILQTGAQTDIRMSNGQQMITKDHMVKVNGNIF